MPRQECCGLPFISNGLYDHARTKARRNLAVLAEFARAGYRIVGTSTSCTHSLKAEYREMLDLADDDATAVADATWDICELLLDLHERGELDTRFAPIVEPLPYHPPCQLKSHGIGTPAMDLFALVPGLRAADSDHDCCGAAGTYGLKVERWQIAQDVGAPLFDRVRAAQRAGHRAPPATPRPAAGRSSSPPACPPSTRSPSWPSPTGAPMPPTTSPGAASSDRPVGSDPRVASGSTLSGLESCSPLRGRFVDGHRCRA